ncbi:hypothetical protein BAUCODRAFT_104253 [Baudoinia panamericana UAMH 10762]|uniref:NAD(P)-binding protein n=1 Tax=Baudoinia panamericana (strain UAMH 10762) TaxID=717646 RepID=M2N5H8_BAUPA|nr:uncharacterized protein BAUCODRAFT_104253 [Baudoinia panamericana UAMH 10762]EMC99288.1 hypothetical protein BAUCODRAFT_104253 [Baudoinia panamericana UAMH 10762]
MSPALSTIPNPYADAHKSPEGPGDARPTTAQILADNDAIGKFVDKTFLVTGGTDGLGLETVRSLLKTGAHVWFSARNEGKAEKVKKELLQQDTSARLDWIKIDNASLESVQLGAEDFLRRSKNLNVLICNAGIGNVPHSLTKEGHEIQFGVNHLAHFYLFQLLRPLLLASSTPSFNSRVVTVSSLAHSFATDYAELVDLGPGYNPLVAYGQSKTANIWMTNEIERRYGAHGIHGIAVHPGNIQTAAFLTFDQRAMEKLAPIFQKEEFQKAFLSVEQGAANQVLAAIGRDFEGKGGFYMNECGVAQIWPDNVEMQSNGYLPWAYNPEGEKRLWADSLEMVGLKDEQ